jgi:hypothetical protein
MNKAARRVLIQKIKEALELSFREGYKAGDNGKPFEDALDASGAFNLVRKWIPESTNSGEE